MSRAPSPPRSATPASAGEGDLPSLAAVLADEAAARAYLARVRAIVGRYARTSRLIAEREDDVVQDVMLAMANTARSGAEIAKPEAWLYTVATNAVRRTLRRELPVAEVEVELGDPPSAEGPSPELRLTLAAALRQLDPDARALIHERYWLGLPSAATAASRGVTENVVRVRLHRSLARLRRAVKPSSAPSAEARKPVPGRGEGLPIGRPGDPAADLPAFNEKNSLNGI